jgi:dihydrolipoamide dehydrogenase
MPDFDYQLVVIGSGPGGYVAAIRASQLGLKTAIVEKDKTLGGTCLNVGCIPSKALLASSEYLHFAQERFAAHGIITGGIKLDLGAMMKRKCEVVGKLTSGVAYLMKKNKIEVVKGFGKLVDGHTVEVTGGDGAKKTLKAENILLASGSVPVELPFLKFDGKRVISSDQGIALERCRSRCSSSAAAQSDWNSARSGRGSARRSPSSNFSPASPPSASTPRPRRSSSATWKNRHEV